MNKLIEKNLNKILGIFILIQPILDLITGICVNAFDINITIGIIVRVIFLLFLLYTTTFIYKRKLSLSVYISLFIYSLLYLLGVIIYKDGVVFYELQGLVKALYFPLVLISLYDLKDEIRISTLTLFTTLFLYLGLILIPNILGIGFDSYEISKSGSIGFFNAANEISGIISLLTPIMFIIVKELKNKVLKVLFPVIYLIVILTIGTKTPLLTLFITLGMSFLYYMVTCLKKKSYKPIVYSGLLIVVGISCLLLILPKTTFYKNIELHLDFTKENEITGMDFVDHFIFSERLTFLEKKAAIYSESSFYEHLFGVGYTANGKQSKLIEMDYFDILYSHGIVGFILIFAIYGIVLYKLSRSRKEMTYCQFMLKTSVLLVIILSLFTGHIITAPAVSIIAVAILLETAKKDKMNLIFSTVHFDLGGIETSLVNLLGRIDYDKYNVTVTLEEKRGIFLDQVNKNVKLTEVKVVSTGNPLLRKMGNLLRRLWFTVLNYKTYDFSCCYATYSLSANKIARISSNYPTIYIHNNYRHIYPSNEEFFKFFNDRNISEFIKIIFVANESKRDFEELYPNLKSRLTVINNFVDTKSILEKSKEKISEKKPKKETLFVFVGRLEEDSKRLTRAINLINKTKDTVLWLIGDGPDRKMYENLIKELKLEKRVIMMGRKSNPYPYLKQADYLLLTSNYEGFPVVYVESILLGKPIITTIDVSDEQLNIGKDFAYIISKDEDKMVKEVKSILKEKPKTKTISYDEVQDNRYKVIEKLFEGEI